MNIEQHTKQQHDAELLKLQKRNEDSLKDHLDKITHLQSEIKSNANVNATLKSEIKFLTNTVHSECEERTELVKTIEKLKVLVRQLYSEKVN